MKLKNIPLIVACFSAAPLISQAQNVGINNDNTQPAASAMLDVKSTEKGILIPRMTSGERIAIAAPANGLMVYDITTNGFWYFNGTTWSSITGSSTATGWALIGNAGTDTANFIGTTDAKTLRFRVNNQVAGFVEPESFNASVALGSATLQGNISGVRNTGIGIAVLKNNTTGSDNTAIGRYALIANTIGSNNAVNGASSMVSNTIGYNNTANGSMTLYNNITGSQNTAAGAESVYSNTSGYNNTAAGARALYSNTTGHQNVAIGVASLYNTTTASNLVAVGDSALHSNTSGFYNVAIGAQALKANTTGNNNIATGIGALYNNTAGARNVAIGANALYSNTTASNLVAVGDSALYSNTTGTLNVALGSSAMSQNTMGIRNVAIGAESLKSSTNGYYNIASGYKTLTANTSGNSNIAIGDEALKNNTTGNLNVAVGDLALELNTAGFHNVAVGGNSGTTLSNLSNSSAIGYMAKVDASNKVRIGNTDITSIGGQVGWTTYSDARFKRNIKNDVPGLAFIQKLQPITYTVDVTGIEQYQGADKNNTVEKGINRTANPAAATNIQSGFLAQDVEKAARQLGYDFSGVDVPTNDKALYGLRYADFVVPLVKAIQEQQAIIEALQKRIETLETK